MAATGDPSKLAGEAIELIKAAHDSVKDAGLTQAADKLMDIREKLGSVRESVLVVREDNLALLERIKTLEGSLHIRATLVRNKGVYWAEDDPDPWCPNCWEHQQRAVHLNRSDLMAGRLCTCVTCQYSVNLDHTAPPKDWPPSTE